MILGNWILVDGEVRFSGKPNEQAPASEIYNALGYGAQERDGLTDPSADLPSISFSRRGISLSFACSVEASGALTLNPKIKKLGRTIPATNLQIPIPEHIVVDNCWYFFNSGVSAANAALSSAGITSFGTISISQYYKLVSLFRAGSAPHINDDLLPELKKIACGFKAPLSHNLHAELYSYQHIGYQWLCFMSTQTNGCVLGDEMGLGKTLQVIALLLARHETGYGSSLVIAPVSLLENWKRELNRFAPTLRVLVHHGSKRTGFLDELLSYDVVVLSYGSANSDLGMLRTNKWDVVVLDEAQAIKNPQSQRSETVKAIPHAFGIAVSGTPFENHILDVWSIFNFSEPELLGDQDEFSQTYPDDLEGAARLEGAITPFILRRTVAEVADDLPEKIVASVPLTPFDCEAIQYEAVRQQTISELGANSASLASLTKLRMYCTHPFCMDDSAFIGGKLHSDPFNASSKYQHLCLLLEEMVSRKEKVLIFTSFRRMIEIFCHDIPARFDVGVMAIDGSTPPSERQSIVDNFSAMDGAGVLVLNPTAAGTGLNITAANNVIHYNLEWNPAKEDQATARSYRRGQKQIVRVYRLYYAETVEEGVLNRMESKRAMAESAIVGTSGQESDREALVRSLSLTPLRTQNG